MILIMAGPVSYREFEVSLSATPLERVSLGNAFISILSILYIIIDEKKDPASDTMLSVGAVVSLFGVLILNSVIKIGEDDYSESKLNAPAE
jgi:hypothetical protein